MKANNNKTILLVEDEAIIAISQKLALEKFGYNVLSAHTGEKAIEIFNNKNIDLILVDIDLGKGIDGTETAEIILKKHNVPVVFLSSHTEPEFIHKMEKITSYGYVVKNSLGIILDASIKMAFKLFEAHEKVKNELAERKIAEETLLNSENRYRVLIDLAVDGILLGSNEGIITDANECMCEILRMKREDFIGKHVSLLPFTKESIEKNPLRFDLLQKGETVISERSLIRPDGIIATIEMRSKMMPDGSYQSIYRDISERKSAEEKLRESEEKFRNLFENMNDAFALHKIILNEKGEPADYQFLEANSIFLQRLGMKAEDLINRTALELFPKTEKSWIDKFGEVAITGKSMHYTNYSVELDKYYETNIYCPRPGYFAALFTDVTERKKTDAELLRNQIKFKSAFNNNPYLMMISEISTGQMLEVNEAFIKETGFSRDEILSNTSIALGLISPEDREKLKQKLLIEGKIIGIEVQLCRKNGSRFWVKYYGEIINLEGKQNLLSIANDITETKKAEEDLRKSEALLKMTLETAQIGLFDWDLKNDILFASPTYYTMLGYDPVDGPVDRNFWRSKGHPDDRDYVENKIKRVLSRTDNSNYEYDARILHSDGSYRWINVLGKVVECDNDEKATRMLGVRIDINERKLLEMKLEESKFFFKESQRAAAIGSFKTDFLTNLWESSEVLDIIFGIEENYNRSIQGWLDIVHPDDQDMMYRYLTDEVIIKMNPFIKEYRIIRKNDGETRWVHGIGKVDLDKNGNVAYLIGTIQDITDRKKAEEEKQLLMERLQRSEKMEALGLLAGGVAHDLNNVLGSIVGFAELTLMDVDKKNPIRPNLENIMNSGLRAADIVQDLLTMARRGVSGRKVINLNRIISDFEHLPEYEKLYSYNSMIKIKTVLEPDLLNISGSAVHLGKTIYNLVLNAVEATVNQGDVTIKTYNKYLEKPVHGYADIKEGDYVVVSVTDTGEGIPESDLKHIFEPFYTKKFMGRSGTGLGLSIVWGTVKDHNGYINVQSEKGKGTSFILYFPVSRDEIEDADISLSISEYTGNGETILIIDDVKEQRELAAAMLKRLNYKVETASSGEEAVEYLKKYKADLLVLDMIMEPGMDGLDTYKNILKIHSKQKVIISSGFSESDRVNDARYLGAGAYVKKPYVFEKLGMAVKKELEK